MTNNLVDANEIHPTVIKGNLFKEILNSNLYGKHPYASLFTQKSVKNIKILPPLVLTQKRVKRNIKQLKKNAKINTAEETLPKIIKNEQQVDTTSSPIDQATEQIIITEVSGTPASVKDDNRPLNIQPFVITTSDFQNNTNSNPAGLNFEEIQDVGKMIKEKLEKISKPDAAVQREEQDKKDEISEDKEETDNTQQDEIKIFVSDKNIQNEEAKSTNANEENLPAETLPEISESFARHFLQMDTTDPEKLIQSSKQLMDKKDNTVKINGEDYSLPKIEHNPSEISEEIKEKNKYFDEIIHQQMKENYRLAQELEYPELDNEYEKYRDFSEKEYHQEKIDDFTVAAEPYIIQLKGFYPYENEEEHDYKDDVDVGTDTERLEKEEQTQADQNKNEEQTENLQENEEQTKEQAENEDKKQYQEDEEDSESTLMKYSVMPKVKPQEIQKMKDEIINIKTKEKKPEASSLKKHAVPPSQKNQPIRRGSKTKNKKRELFQEPDFMADLYKILEKRNAFSRYENVEDPEEYNTFWSLEYEVPNK